MLPVNWILIFIPFGLVRVSHSGGGSVGRAVASDSRGPRFESSHRQKFILNIYCQLSWKDENKEKEAGNGPFKKKSSFLVSMLKNFFVGYSLKQWTIIWTVCRYSNCFQHQRSAVQIQPSTKFISNICLQSNILKRWKQRKKKREWPF